MNINHFFPSKCWKLTLSILKLSASIEQKLKSFFIFLLLLPFSHMSSARMCMCVYICLQYKSVNACRKWIKVSSMWVWTGAKKEKKKKNTSPWSLKYVNQRRSNFRLVYFMRQRWKRRKWTGKQKKTQRKRATHLIWETRQKGEKKKIDGNNPY